VEKMNPEGLTFEEWVCAAGVAIYTPNEVQKFKESRAVWRKIYPDTVLTPEGWGRSFIYNGVHYYKKTISHQFYKTAIRKAWKNGEDPTEYQRTQKEPSKIDAFVEWWEGEPMMVEN
jgi:hypothetical protein